MTQLIAAEFFGLPVSIHDYNGRRWLTAEAAGICLGYPPETARQSIGKIYERQADEFTEADTFVVNLTTNSRGNPNTRIFSATGCIKLGFFAHTPTAKQFRSWAATTLEAQAPAPAPAEEPLPAVTRSPRLETSLARMADSVETLASGMRTMSMQLDVTARYIGLLELNQQGKRRITADVVREAKAMAAEGMSQSDIARLLRISRTAVSLVVRDKYPIAIPEADAPQRNVGELLEGWIEREQARLAQTLSAGGEA